MQIKPPVEHLNEPVLRFARQDFATLNQNLTIEQALASIRQRGVGEKIVYFYVVDDEEKLVGVVPTRRLLMAALDTAARRIDDPQRHCHSAHGDGDGSVRIFRAAQIFRLPDR